MKLSDCCGAAPRGNGDSDSEDIGICPDCGEHCEYIEYCEDCDEEIKACTCVKVIKPIATPDWDRGGTGHGDISWSDADPGL